MHEHAVMAIIKGFEQKYLTNQTLMGFAVIDEEQGILVAASFNQKYGKDLSNPIKRWIIYQTSVGFTAFETKSEEDFKSFAVNKFRFASA